MTTTPAGPAQLQPRPGAAQPTHPRSRAAATFPAVEPSEARRPLPLSPAATRLQIMEAAMAEPLRPRVPLAARRRRSRAGAGAGSARCGPAPAVTPGRSGPEGLFPASRPFDRFGFNKGYFCFSRILNGFWSAHKLPITSASVSITCVKREKRGTAPLHHAHTPFRFSFRMEELSVFSPLRITFFGFVVQGVSVQQRKHTRSCIRQGGMVLK